MASDGVEFADVSFTTVPRKGEPGRSILRGISFSVRPGSTTALIGRSGSGKTTLLRTVNGLVRPTSGKVLVGQADVSTENPIGLRRGIGYVIQETGLFPHMPIRRNIGMALELADRPKDEIANRVDDMLELVGLGAESNPEIGQRFPWQLSGGQRQRVGLARALAADPSVLLMDEPFGALDPLTRAEMQTMLRDLLRRVEKTTLIVTHDLNEALYLADRVVLFEQGQIVADMAAGEVTQSDNAAVQEYIAATIRAPEPRGGTSGRGAP